MSRYGGESSDQEDLVDASGGSEMDDEVTDVDEIQFACDKSDSASMLNPSNDPASDNTSLRDATAIVETKLKLALLGVGLCLMASTFLLLFIHPLYLKQLELGGENYNAFGSLLFVSTVIMIIFIGASAFASWKCKWSIKFYQFPIPAKGLFTISSCCGLAGTLCAISSYRRVPCHLQDPLKGAALVYALAFYFFFCRKVMGLQRIFSATTAVVGLFISVDYGLCDEFRCRGKDVVEIENVSTGWQDRALWTLLYVVGIALWTLHLSLLEGHVVTLPGSITQNLPPMSFLTTVSRIVSRNEPLLHEREPPKPPRKYKPKALHLVAWIHFISFICVIIFGWIDMIPRAQHSKESATTTTSFPSNFWVSTGKTIMCHINFHPTNDGIDTTTTSQREHQESYAYLSNMTPHSVLYNETLLRLRRTKREITNSMNGSHDSINKIRYINDVLHEQRMAKTTSHLPVFPTTTTTEVVAETNGSKKNTITTTTTSNVLNDIDGGSNKKTEHHVNTTQQHNNNKINTEKHWRFVKNKIRQKIKFIDSHNQPPSIMSPSSSRVSSLEQSMHMVAAMKPNCQRLHNYAWLFILSYILFAMSLFSFLVLSESTVFTVTIITSALPLIGIFWSLFELQTSENKAFIMWSPEVTGELICSLLGTPIVFLGLGLLCRAHFRDGSSSIPHQRFYNSLS